MTPRDAHHAVRAQAVHCQGCGVAVAIVVEIPNPTPEQVDEARAVMLQMKVWVEHGMVRLRPVEEHAEALGRRGRRPA